MSHAHCTVILTVAVLFARLGSGVSAIVVALSVITVPAGAVDLPTTTLTGPRGIRSHGAVFVANDLSGSRTDTAEPYTCLAPACRRCGCSRRRGALRHLRGQHFGISVVRSEVPYREGIGDQIALLNRLRSGADPQVQISWLHQPERVNIIVTGGEALMYITPFTTAGEDTQTLPCDSSTAWRRCWRSAHTRCRQPSRHKPPRSPPRARNPQ